MTILKKSVSSVGNETDVSFIFNDDIDESVPEILTYMKIRETPPMTLEEAIKLSAIVADVTVVKNLGDNYSYNCTENTIFKLKVNNVFNGSLPETIYISQIGSKDVIVTHYPLFEVGDRLLLCLAKYSNDNLCECMKNFDEVDYDNFYSISGTCSVMDITEKNGSLFVLDRYGTNISFRVNEKSITNIKNSNTNLLNEFLNRKKNIAKTYIRSEINYKGIYNYNEILNEFANRKASE